MQTSADYFSVSFCMISLQFCKQRDQLFVFTTHEKFVVLVPLVFSQFYNIQNTADLRLYPKYELLSIESFDYTNFSEYGIKSLG